MDKPLKLFANSSLKRNEVDDKQISQIADHPPQQRERNIKINDAEKYPFKAVEQQKFPSFHKVLGPALTG